MQPEKIYLSLRKFVENYRELGWITEASVRRIFRLRKEKKFESAFHKMGKRILIDPDEFFECIHKKKEKSGSVLHRVENVETRLEISEIG